MVKKLTAVLTVAMLVAAFGASAAFAQSSGNFTAGFDKTVCTPAGIAGGNTTGVPGSIGPVQIKVSSGSGVALVVTPSLITGLFTSNNLNKNTTTSTANIGVGVWLEVRDSNNNLVTTVLPLAGSAADPIIYDWRLIQITSSALSALLQCTTSTAASSSCFNLTEATLSAHSFNFVLGNLSSGTYRITLHWAAVTPITNSSSSATAACAGPGSLTVTQVKNFSFNTQLSF